MTFCCDAKSELVLRRAVRTSLGAWARVAAAERGFSPARHHVLMLQKLERLAESDGGRLMLLMPPGAAKSTYASLIFPAWWLARRPTSSIVAASHTAALAGQFGRGVRSLVETHAARLCLGLKHDARAALRFATREGGEYFGIGVTGAVTGRRADLALIDDPIKSFAEAESRPARDALWDWYRSELTTRLRPHGRIAVVMTRWHEDDLAGRLMAQGGWEVLCLPALAGEADPLGRAAGDALWPEWEGAEALRVREAQMGARGFSALYQQAPFGAAGVLFPLVKVPIVDVAPEGEVVRGWDLAATAGDRSDPDWTVGVRMIRDAHGGYCVDDVRRFRGGPGEVLTAVIETARQDGPAVGIGLPQDPGQAGKSQVMIFARALSGYRIVASRETGAKETRAGPVAGQIDAGNVSILRAGWTAAFLDELRAFPNGSKDDQVDALSRAFGLLQEGGGAKAHYATMPIMAR